MILHKIKVNKAVSSKQVTWDYYFPEYQINHLLDFNYLAI